MQFPASITPISSFKLYLLISRDSSFCSVIVAMQSFCSQLKQKGFIVSFSPKRDERRFFWAAAHQLKQVSKSGKNVRVPGGNVSYKSATEIRKVIASILPYFALFVFYILLITTLTKVACQ